MSIDKTKHDYPEVEGFTNVLMEVDIGTDPTIIYNIASAIRPGIRRLAVARPEWTFIGNRTTHGSGLREVTQFIVYDGTERLGKIERDYRNGDHVYAITNTRIAKNLQRGDTRYTKDTTKALKIVYGTFSPKSPGEAFNEARMILNNKLNQVANGVEYEWGRVRNSFAVAAIDEFLLARWDELMAFVEQHPTVPNSKAIEIMRNGPQLRENMRNLQRMQEEYGASRGYIVLIRGGQYVVKSPGGADALMYVPKLPERLKTGMGMLKLVQDGTAITGVGFRHDAGTFYLMDPNPPQETEE